MQSVEAVGENNVIVFIRTSSTGRASGIATGTETTNVDDFHEGKISRIRIFLDRDEALKALEPPEWAMSRAPRYGLRIPGSERD